MADSHTLRTAAETRHEADVWDLSHVQSPLQMGPLGYLSWLLCRRALGVVQGRVLDAGGGDGRFGDLTLRDDGHYLMDIAAGAVGKRRVVNIGIAGDMCHLPFAAGSFAGILASDVLEHLPEELAQPALSELNRILAPGGVLALNTSCYGIYMRRLEAKLAGVMGRLDKYDKADGHLNRFRAPELQGMFAKVGLQVEWRLHYKHFFQPMLRLLFDVPLRRLLGGRRHSLPDSTEKQLKVAKQGLKARLISLFDAIRAGIALMDVLFFGWWLPGGATVWCLRKSVDNNKTDYPL